MAERRFTGTPGSRFVVCMLVILIFLFALVFSIRKHAAPEGSPGTRPSQRLHP